MPRYFIDSFDGDTCFIDSEGMDFADDAAARYHALDALPDMARDEVPDGDRRRFVVSVRDQAGEVIYSASLTLEGGWRSAPDGLARFGPQSPLG
jgi:hypothetical protein